MGSGKGTSKRVRSVKVKESAIPVDGIFYPNKNEFITGVGNKIKWVHEETDECKKFGCVIHNQTNHNMRHLPTSFRMDTKLVERICFHGVGHPDPDAVSGLLRVTGKDLSAHGCCGCCSLNEGEYNKVYQAHLDEEERIKNRKPLTLPTGHVNF